MGLSVCPIANVEAPIEVVWSNLVHWENYADWAGVHVESIEPSGSANVGQIITFAGKAVGRTWRFTFHVDEIDPARHQLGLHVYFPFGLEELPHISCFPIDEHSCRVQYG